jgi:hypothetical protein
MDLEAQRAEFTASLRAAAEQRFGTERAEAIATMIDEMARRMAEVAVFPVAADEPPAFYAEPAP